MPAIPTCSATVQVANYATAIANELNLPPERVKQVRQPAFVHDIGKVGISEQVLHKPGSLTEDEYEKVKTHAALGADLLDTCQGLRYLVPFVRQHHERWDGKGYPDGLRGEQISLEGRILAVADAVEAMASDRPYHQAMSPSAIIAEVRRCAGGQFAPSVAEAFVRVAEREKGSLIVNSARETWQTRVENGHGMHYVSGNESVAIQEMVPAMPPTVRKGMPKARRSTWVAVEAVMP